VRTLLLMRRYETIARRSSLGTAPPAFVLFSERDVLTIFSTAGCITFATLSIVVLLSVPFFCLPLTNLLGFVVVGVPGAFVCLFVLGICS
jgi:hypothetical protein